MKIKKDDKISLYWVMKFTMLYDDKDLSDKEILNQFYEFCQKEEKAFNERIQKQRYRL